MSTLKTATSAITAVALVAGIGIAVAQTHDQPQTQPMTPATQPSEQTPADLTAQQTPPVTDPAMPLDSSTRSTRSTDPMRTDNTGTGTPGDTGDEPAPRADRT